MTTNKPITEKICEWLEHQGAPLEMRVAKAFMDSGVYISQSVYYRDPETNAPREIDVVATDEGEFVDYFIFSVEFMIECKKSSLPWVLFTSQKPSYDHLFVSGWVCSSVGSIAKQKLVNILHNNALHQWSGKWAYGVCQGLRNGASENGDVPYKALMSCVKASHALTRQTDEKVWDPQDERVCFGSMTQPVIVLDGQLFEAFIDNSGNLIVTEVEAGLVSFRYPFLNHPDERVSVRIVTLPALPKFVADAKATMDEITDSKTILQKTYDEHFVARTKS